MLIISKIFKIYLELLWSLKKHIHLHTRTTHTYFTFDVKFEILNIK